MKKVLILAVLLLGCSHSRHLTKSQRTVASDTLNLSKVDVKKSVTDSSQSLTHTGSLDIRSGRDMSIIETATKSGTEPIILTGNFKIDTAAGGGIKLASNGATLTANYDKKTGLIKVKVKVEGRGEQTTYTKQINIKDTKSLQAQDSVSAQQKLVKHILDSLDKVKAAGSHLLQGKIKVVDSKTKWPAFQLIGVGVAIIALIWALARRKTIVGWVKRKIFSWQK